MVFYCQKMDADIDVCTCLNEKYCTCDSGRKFADKKKPNLAERAIHPALNGSCGGFADLSSELSKEGFEYQYKAGDAGYFDTGIALFKNSEGKQAILQRIAKGATAHQTGRTNGIIYIGAKPDVWQRVTFKEYSEAKLTL